jgi:zinc/manganese transport system permease protein
MISIVGFAFWLGYCALFANFQSLLAQRLAAWRLPDWFSGAFLSSPLWMALLYFILSYGAGFYLVFACAVTASVQLVGVYLVFTTLIVPALATQAFQRRRLLAGYALGAASYAAGLAISLTSDLPPGPLIVCIMTGLGIAVFLVFRPAAPR